MEEAEESYREALRLEPKDPQALYRLGALLVERDKNLDEALGLLRRAADGLPSDPPVLLGLGLAYLKLGRLEEAERHLGESVRRDGRSALGHELLGDLHSLRGNAQKARDAWSKALSLSTEAKAQDRLKGKLSGTLKE